MSLLLRAARRPALLPRCARFTSPPSLRPHLSTSRAIPKTRTASYGKPLLYASTLALASGIVLYPTTLHAKAPPPREEPHLLQEDLLSASDHERAQRRLHRRKTGRKTKRLAVRIQDFLVDYLVEPIACTFRAVYLLLLFAPVVLSVPVAFLGSRVKDKQDERSGTLLWYRILVRAMEKAGPAFIKLGQWAASRTDIFPTELCALMGVLHSNAPAHSFAETKRIIEKSFGSGSFDDIFEYFDEVPLGTGAIAQVYRGKLRPGIEPPSFDEEEMDFRRGLRMTVDRLVKRAPAKVPSTEVAIKVLHPHVDRLVQRDLRIMNFFANVLNLIPTVEWLSLPDEVLRFGEMMRLQLDLRIEANNLATFRHKFKDRTTVYFPIPYTEFSTREVLVEEYAHGVPLEAFLENGGGSFQKDVADMGLDAFLRMLLIDNFIHADLHPGNIMITFRKPESLTPTIFDTGKEEEEAMDNDTKVFQRLQPFRHDKAAWNKELDQLDREGYRPLLIFIDTGLVTELNDLNRRNFLDLFKSIAEFDGLKAGQLMIERCRQPDAVINGDVFALRMQNLVLGVKARTFALGRVKIGDLLSEVLSMVRTYHVRLEGDFVNVVLSILLLEGIGRSLDPNLDLFKTALPMLRQLGAQSAGGFASGDFGSMKDAGAMLKVWIALEAREYLNLSIEAVENAVKYDLLSPNI